MPRIVSVEALDDYRERIDVRSPSEYLDDHVPGAQSHPVLSDEERALIGTMYARDGGFAAKRAGAALVSRHIADMLENDFRDKPRDWAPLVYCWRGGKRSASLAHILNEIGWRVVQLEGGYRAFRRHVRAELERLPIGLDLRVVCGLTGSGKSRLLAALAAEGAQVIDLEGLAAHRGSLLGDLPDAPQPSQKRFETLVYEALRTLGRARPIYVESESRRIGKLQVPESLLATMRAAPCVRVELASALRVALLREEYAHFLDDIDRLEQQLAALVPLHGRDIVARWNAAARAGAWDEFVGALLAQHYDPTYTRAMDRNFPRHSEARVVQPQAIDMAHYREIARSLMAEEVARGDEARVGSPA
ncbi:MAG TPA: tRNA 2-selenouridine(34) synthase MnmH [Casimicrobiaceae bacterium]|nr:tRNA 2-selenouridine(34) synthase MnmH [Casimicrobiaceae bacterium]